MLVLLSLAVGAVGVWIVAGTLRAEDRPFVEDI